MLLAAVVLEFRVDLRHKRVALHRRVGERRTGEDAHNFRADWWQDLQRASEDAVDRAVVHDDQPSRGRLDMDCGQNGPQLDSSWSPLLLKLPGNWEVLSSTGQRID